MKNSPVWDVYDLYRTARLNVKYNTGRLYSLNRFNFWMEVILAVTVPSSAVAGLTLWETTIGKIIWSLLGILSSLLAIAKPLLGLTKRIQELEELCAGYRVLDHDLQKIVIGIHQRGAYDDELRRMFVNALDREGQLVSVSKETKEDTELKKRCEAEVLQELPVDSFFIPG